MALVERQVALCVCVCVGGEVGYGKLSRIREEQKRAELETSPVMGKHVGQPRLDKEGQELQQQGMPRVWCSVAAEATPTLSSASCWMCT